MRYYPAGYVGTERAIFMIAAAKDPELWSCDAIPSEERLVWEGMNVTWNGLVLNQHLPYSIPPDQRAGAIDRLCSFYRALDLLRKALHLSSITAEFCDERGRFDYVQKDGWGGEAGLDILLSGVADLAYGTDIWTRLVLLREDRIRELIAKTDPFLLTTPHEVALQQRGSPRSKTGRAEAPFRVGKQRPVILWLEQRFSGKPVPPPSVCPRKGLISEALAQIQALGGKLDETTMKNAIDAYNKAVDDGRPIRNDPN